MSCVHVMLYILYEILDWKRHTEWGWFFLESSKTGVSLRIWPKCLNNLDTIKYKLFDFLLHIHIMFERNL